MLREETAEGRNGWYEARERLGQVAGYLSDVDRAWRLAEEAFADREAPIAIGLQCRYALIVTSLCCLAGNIHPALLSALVKNRMRSGPQGLAYARQVQNHEQRSESLAAVAPYLNPAEQERPSAMRWRRRRAIGDEEARSRALTALVPLPDQALAPRGVGAARAIGDEKARSEALAALAPCLTEPWLREALEAARAIYGEKARSRARGRAGPLPDRALAPRGAGGGVGHRGRAVPVRGAGRAGPALAELGHPAKALEVARAIGDEKARFRALAALVPYLGPTERDRALGEARGGAGHLRREGSVPGAWPR